MNIPRCEIKSSTPAHRQVMDSLEQMIRSGQLAPAARLPSAMEMAKEWNVSYVAMHKALSLLTKKGLLERCSRRGTFVRSERQIVAGIVCGVDLGSETAHFYRKLVHDIQTEMERRNAEGASFQWSVRVYDGLMQPSGQGMTAKRLLEDFQKLPLGCLIAIDVDLKSLGLPKNCDKLPVVRLVKSADMLFDRKSFAYDAVRHLHDAGRKRIVFISKSSAESKEEALLGLREAAEECGIDVPPHLEIPYRQNEGGAELERSAYESMLSWLDAWKRGGAMPDGIIADDDIGMRGLALALVKKGVQVPEKLEAVCLANEGISHHYGIPVARYELPLSQFSAKTVELLISRIEGRPESGEPIVFKGAIKEEAPNG